MWEDTVDINKIAEIRTRTLVYFGVGAINKIADIAAELKARGVDAVLVTAGHSAYRRTGAWDKVEAALKANNLAYFVYDKVTPNPTAEQVDEAVAEGRKINAGAVIAIGGGSPIDAGKSAAILLKNPGEDARSLYEMKFAPTAALPIVAINLTHGTGSETNRFAVVTIPEKHYKPAIAYDCIYPTWAIDDPALTAGLSTKQTRYVSIDAVNHVVEAATSKVATPYTALLAKETIRLVAKYLPAAIADGGDLKARYFLHYASMLAGVGFDNGLLHYTHALEHPLSAVEPELERVQAAHVENPVALAASGVYACHYGHGISFKLVFQCSVHFFHEPCCGIVGHSAAGRSVFPSHFHAVVETLHRNHRFNAAASGDHYQAAVFAFGRGGPPFIAYFQSCHS